MRKSPGKKRARDLQKIWDHRNETLNQEGSAASRDSTRHQAVEFCYAAEERGAIARELTGDTEVAAALLSESLDEIELLVRLTLQASAYREQHPIADELKAQFRAIDKPIKQVLAVLDNPEMRHLAEVVPNLRTELTFLLNMSHADQRKGRGKPQDPTVELHRSLIAMLALVWTRHRGKWPTRFYSDEKGRDWSPFYRFLSACLKPTTIQASDYVIRKALRTGHK